MKWLVELLRRNSTVLVGVIAGVVVAFFLWRVVDDLRAPQIVVVDPFSDREIVVEIRGAINQPGVYALPATSRVTDAVQAAGGTRDDADITGVNLAARLSDADQIEIPSVPDANAPLPLAVPDQPVVGGEILQFLNTASEDDLDGLPGIGPVLARRIVETRSTNGPFETLDDLVAIDGISAAMIDEITTFLTTDR